MKCVIQIIICLLTVTNSGAQDTQYAGDAVQLGAGARALGLGGAFVAIADDATAFYWNPAGLATHTQREIHAQHTEQFGGTVNHDIVALSYPALTGGFGIGLIRLGTDGILLTQLEDPNRPLGPDNRPTITETASTTDNTLFLAYAHRINPTLTLGITTKFIHRDLSVGTGTGFGIDLGCHYQLRQNLILGLSIRDITKTRIAFNGGHSDPISPNALVGTSYVHQLSPSNHVLGSVSIHLGGDQSGIEESQVVGLGLEYQFKKRLMLRLGRRSGHLTAGAGLKLARASIDLAYLENKQLNNTYRISTSIYF